MLTGFVSFCVEEKEKKGEKADLCLDKGAWLHHRQDLDFVLRIEGSWHFLPGSATFFFFFNYDNLPPGNGKRKV